MANTGEINNGFGFPQDPNMPQDPFQQPMMGGPGPMMGGPGPMMGGPGPMPGPMMGGPGPMDPNQMQNGFPPPPNGMPNDMGPNGPGGFPNDFPGPQMGGFPPPPPFNQQGGFPQNGPGGDGPFGFGNDGFSGNGPQQRNMNGFNPNNNGMNQNNVSTMDSNVTRELFGRIDLLSNMLRNNEMKVDQQKKLIDKNSVEQEKLQTKLTKLINETREIDFDDRYDEPRIRPLRPRSPFAYIEPYQAPWDDDCVYPVSAVVYPPRMRQVPPPPSYDDMELRPMHSYQPAFQQSFQPKSMRKFSSAYPPLMEDDNFSVGSGGSPYFGYVRAPRRRR